MSNLVSQLGPLYVLVRVNLCCGKQSNSADDAAVTGSFKPMSHFFDADTVFLESNGRLEDEKHGTFLV